MKKIFFITFLLFGLVSFSQNQNLIGKWTKCKSFCNGITANANVCTYLDFKENNTLIIKYPGETEIITWKIENGLLKVLSSNLVKSILFEVNKVYELKFNNENELLLFEKGNPNCYEILLK